MATKRIVKFLLKLVVAAAIVIGAFFGIKALFDARNKNNLIVNASINAKISEKVLSSADGLEIKSDSYSTRTKISSMQSINKVLVDYYNYYVSLTVFEHAPDESMRNQIIGKINELSKKVDATKDSLQFVENTSLSSDIKEQRILFSANLYIQQTQLLFELDELLQKYVYLVNYSIDMKKVSEIADIEGVEQYYMDTTGIAYEAKLEMMKDYCKTVFNTSIVSSMDKTDELSGLLVNKDKETNFAKVLDKFFDKQDFDVNGDEEVHFSQFYMNISKTKLNEFYKLDDASKFDYKNTMSNETERKYFNSLYNYLNRTSF